MRGFWGLRSPSITSILSSLTAVVVLLGCAPKLEEDTVETVYQCELPQDQSKTLSGRWPKLVIPISFKQGDFSGSEISAMIDALETWNGHFRRTQSILVFDYGSRASPRYTNQSSLASLCSYSLLNGSNQFVSSVTIYKRTAWNYGQDVVGLTSSCSKTNSGLPSIYISMIELNFQHFWQPGKRQPDLASILLHELGHLLGIDHSCVAAASPKASGGGYPICEQIAAGHDYEKAIMFPTVFFNADGTGLARQKLQANDQGRANCLYGKSAL